MPERLVVPPIVEDATPSPPPEQGTERVGRYVLGTRIGAGAMGQVWRGEDPAIGRDVAIKILRVPEGLGDRQAEEWRRRFLREARAAGRLSHPGIVAIHDVGEADDGRLFIVMEIVDGAPLDAIVREGRPALVEALEWTAQLAEALDSAHRREIVHRDVKPANILIDVDGRARLVDFGIARLAASELTREGQFLGSPAFASPEQIQGEPVDGRSDLFSLGAVLYLLVTGARPFRGEDLGTLVYEICHVEPPPPGRVAPDLPDGLATVVMKALAKSPAARYSTGREMAADLRAVAAGRRPAIDGGPTLEKTLVAADSPASGARGEPDAPAIERHAAAGEEREAEAIERHAAAGGGRDAASIERPAAAAVALTRGGLFLARAACLAAGRLAAWAMVAAVIALPAAGRGGRSAAAASARLIATGRAAWLRAWSSGRRARALMTAGVAVLLGGGLVVGYLLFGGAMDPARASSQRARAGADAAAPASGTGEPGAGVLSWLTRGGGAGYASVTVRVTHGLPDGKLTVWAGKRCLLSASLVAGEKDVKAFGKKMFSYHRAASEWPLRLSAGEQSLKVRVQSREKDIDLARDVSASMKADGEYLLEINVKTWPKESLGIDWEPR